MSVVNSALPVITRGLLYLRQAHRILDRDYQVAYGDRDWNIAVRRAQEAAENAAKAVYWLNGRAPDKLHALDIPMELLKSLPVVLINSQQDPRESVYAFERRPASDSVWGFEILIVDGASGSVIKMVVATGIEPRPGTPLFINSNGSTTQAADSGQASPPQSMVSRGNCRQASGRPYRLTTCNGSTLKGSYSR